MTDSNETESIQNLFGNTEEAVHTAEVTAWVTGLPARLTEALGGPVDVTLQPITTCHVLRLRVCLTHVNVTVDYDIDHYILRIGTEWHQEQLEDETLRLIDRIQAFLHKEKLVEA